MILGIHPAERECSQPPGGPLKYQPDDASSHEYEVKKVHMDDTAFYAVVFYLRAGEPVNINVEDVLKKTNLWSEPTESEPKKEHHLIFEVQPEDGKGLVDLYISRFDVELGKVAP